MTYLNQLQQTFNSPKVNLEITSFKDKKFWGELMKRHDFGSIWDFMEYLIPFKLFNIYNYHLIEARFMKTPSYEKIARVLRDTDLYCVVKMDLLDPFKGCSVTIHESLEAAQSIPVKEPVSVRLFSDDRSYVLQKYVDPAVEKTIAVLNNFSFYEEFEKYISLGNANQGNRTFLTVSGTFVETDKISIGINRKINWRGIAFENVIPNRDRRRSKYHLIGDNVNALRNDSSFFDVFRTVNHLIHAYVVSANNDDHRISVAENYGPVVYTECEKLMRELRQRRPRTGLKTSDITRCFTPYLEIGESTNEFILGVVSR